MTIHRLSPGGADRVAIHLANAFVEAGWRTEIVVLRDSGEGETALLDLLHRDVRVSCAGPPMGSRHLELVRGLRFIKRRVTAVSPAIVLASSSNVGLVTGIARRRGHRRPRFVMKLTNPVVRPHDERWLRSIYRRRLYGFIFGRFDRVLVLTDAERERLDRDFCRQQGKFETVANPYVTSAMLGEPTPPAPAAQSTLITMARMMPQKRLDRLLRAFALLQCRETRLVILGDGPERDRLEALARELGIADRVDMPGFVADVLPWYRRADMFVLTSDYEGLPGVVLEALACGLPVITTDCFEGARALLAGVDQCEVVARTDIEALAKAIDTRARGKPQCGKLRALALRYSIKTGTAAHLHALRSVLGQMPNSATADGEDALSAVSFIAE